MLRDKRLVTAAVTIFLAGAIGHLMQYGLWPGGGGEGYAAAPSDAASPAARPAAPGATVPGRSGPPVTVMSDALPRPPADALSPASLDGSPVRRSAVPADAFTSPDRPGYRDLNAFGMSCEKALTAAVLGDGFVRLNLSATCNPNERVEVEHAGLRFAMRTSVLGDLEIAVPAFMTEAEFSVIMADGSAASTSIRVPEAASIDRVALQWRGDPTMSIHAFEFGANPGDPGHIYHDKHASTLGRAAHSGGEIVALGDPGVESPRLAEVYSLPPKSYSADGVVRLQVESEVTAFTCGKDAVAEAVQSSQGGRPTVVSVRLAMPGCDAVGDILVLKNILRDLRVVSN